TPILILFVETDGPDTDWIVTLSDVFRDGAHILHLARAAVRATTVQGLQPNTAVEVCLSLTEVGHNFGTGHRIRVAITSSLFPLYARNLNSGEPYADATQPRLARQRIHHTTAAPTRLILPIS